MTAAKAPASAKPPVAGPECCQGVAATMIGHFVTRLEVEAGKAGGSLSAAEIRAFAQHFLDAEQGRFNAVYRRSYDACTAARATKEFESARRRPFDRILMRRFAHLFPPRAGDEGGEGVLSRRIIPGFDLALNKMIGPTLAEQCHLKSMAVLERHRLPDGGPDWERVHADPDAVALSNDVLAVAAHYFADFDKRRAWFVALVNNNLASTRPDAPDLHWQMGESAFAALMHALFGDLRDQMRDRPAALKSRYGDQTFDTLREFFRRLETV